VIRFRSVATWTLVMLAATVLVAAAESPSMQCADYLALGRTQLRQNLLDFAIDSFNSGIALARMPKDAQTLRELRNGLARAYIEAGLFDQADPLINSVASAAPQDGLLLRFLYHKQRGELAPAAQAFLAYSAAAPPSQDTLRVYLDAAEIMFKQNQFEQAGAVLDNLYRSAPQWHGWALYEKAVCTQTYRKDYGSALDLYKQMLSESPEHPCAKAARLAVGQLTLIHLNQPQEARGILQELADSSDCAPGQVAFYLALCSYREGNWAGARREFETLCDSTPSSRYCQAAKEMEAACSRNIAAAQNGGQR